VTQAPPDHLAAWLTITGAIAVALIAAGTAQWRLRKTITAEKERLDAQLEAERVRHAERLVHERMLKDLEELREVLDGAAAALPAVVRACTDLATIAADGPDAWRAAERQRSAFDVALVDGIAQKERLAVRLGRGHEITTFYNEALDHILVLYRRLRQISLAGSSDADTVRATTRGNMEDFERAADAFADAAHEVAGTGHAAS
jgi:hypothetical protein